MSIAICWSDYGSIKSEFSRNLLSTVHQDLYDRQVIKEVISFSGSSLCSNRNKVTKLFLETGIEWALFVDADIIISKDLVYRLYDLALSNRIDILSGLYYIYQNNHIVPAAYVEDILDMSKDVLEASWAGLGAVLVNRKALVHSILVNEYSDGFWFAEIGSGEDHFFFNNIKSHGYKVYVSPTTIFSHIKDKEIAYKDYMLQSYER